MRDSQKEAMLHTALDIAFDLLGAAVIGAIILAGVFLGGLIFEVLT